MGKGDINGVGVHLQDPQMVVGTPLPYPVTRSEASFLPANHKNVQVPASIRAAAHTSNHKMFP